MNNYLKIKTIILILPFLLFILFLILIVRLFSSKAKKFPYCKQKGILSQAEKSFYSVLKQAVGDKAEVFAKVRVADVLTPYSGLERTKWQKAFNKISSKHFDFVICHKKTFEVLCVIELNDKSHKLPHRMKRDEFLRNACKSAKLVMLEIEVQRSYSIKNIKKRLSDCLKLT